ncbi:hypothetical protein HK102_001258, partial [Quaeritorhiza haematococci]
MVNELENLLSDVACGRLLGTSGGLRSGSGPPPLQQHTQSNQHPPPTEAPLSSSHSSAPLQPAARQATTQDLHTTSLNAHDTVAVTAEGGPAGRKQDRRKLYGPRPVPLPPLPVQQVQQQLHLQQHVCQPQLLMTQTEPHVASQKQPGRTGDSGAAATGPGEVVKIATGKKSEEGGSICNSELDSCDGKCDFGSVDGVIAKGKEESGRRAQKEKPTDVTSMAGKRSVSGSTMPVGGVEIHPKPPLAVQPSSTNVPQHDQVIKTPVIHRVKIRERPLPKISDHIPPSESCKV